MAAQGDSTTKTRIPVSAVHATLFMLAGAAATAGTYAIVKAMPTEISSGSALFWRAAIGLGFAASLYLRQRDASARGMRLLLISRGLVSGIGILGLYFAVHELHSDLAYANVLAKTAPLWVVLLGPLVLGERYSPWLMIPLAIGMCGVTIVSHPESTPHLGALLLLCFVGSCGGLTQILARRLTSAQTSHTIIVHFMATICVLTAPWAFVDLWNHWPFSTAAIALLMANGLLGTVTQYLVLAAYRRGHTLLVSVVGLSEVVFAVVLGVAFFHDVPSGATLLGGALIMVAALAAMLLGCPERKN